MLRVREGESLLQFTNIYGSIIRWISRFRTLVRVFLFPFLFRTQANTTNAYPRYNISPIYKSRIAIPISREAKRSRIFQIFEISNILLHRLINIFERNTPLRYFPLNYPANIRESMEKAKPPSSPSPLKVYEQPTKWQKGETRLSDQWRCTEVKENAVRLSSASSPSLVLQRAGKR